MPQIYDMGPTALLPLRRKACWGFFRPKNPTPSAGFEPANFGTKGQHAIPRPPKPIYIYIYIHTHTHTHTHTHSIWHTQTSDYVQTVYELPSLTNNTAVKTFLQKSGAMRRADWIFIAGAPAWRWLGEYVTLDITFYSILLKQEAVAAATGFFTRGKAARVWGRPLASIHGRRIGAAISLRA